MPDIAPRPQTTIAPRPEGTVALRPSLEPRIDPRFTLPGAPALPAPDAALQQLLSRLPEREVFSPFGQTLPGGGLAPITSRMVPDTRQLKFHELEQLVTLALDSRDPSTSLQPLYASQDPRLGELLDKHYNLRLNKFLLTLDPKRRQVFNEGLTVQQAGMMEAFRYFELDENQREAWFKLAREQLGNIDDFKKTDKGIALLNALGTVYNFGLVNRGVGAMIGTSTQTEDPDNQLFELGLEIALLVGSGGRGRGTGLMTRPRALPYGRNWERLAKAVQGGRLIEASPLNTMVRQMHVYGKAMRSRMVGEAPSIGAEALGLIGQEAAVGAGFMAALQPAQIIEGLLTGGANGEPPWADWAEQLKQAGHETAAGAMVGAAFGVAGATLSSVIRAATRRGGEVARLQALYGKGNVIPLLRGDFITQSQDPVVVKGLAKAGWERTRYAWIRRSDVPEAVEAITSDTHAIEVLPFGASSDKLHALQEMGYNFTIASGQRLREVRAAGEYRRGKPIPGATEKVNIGQRMGAEERLAWGAKEGVVFEHQPTKATMTNAERALSKKGDRGAILAYRRKEGFGDQTLEHLFDVLPTRESKVQALSTAISDMMREAGIRAKKLQRHARYDTLPKTVKDQLQHEGRELLSRINRWADRLDGLIDEGRDAEGVLGQIRTAVRKMLGRDAAPGQYRGAGTAKRRVLGSKPGEYEEPAIAGMEKLRKTFGDPPTKGLYETQPPRVTSLEPMLRGPHRADPALEKAMEADPVEFATRLFGKLSSHVPYRSPTWKEMIGRASFIRNLLAKETAPSLQAWGQALKTYEETVRAGGAQMNVILRTYLEAPLPGTTAAVRMDAESRKAFHDAALALSRKEDFKLITASKGNVLEPVYDITGSGKLLGHREVEVGAWLRKNYPYFEKHPQMVHRFTGLFDEIHGMMKRIEADGVHVRQTRAQQGEGGRWAYASASKKFRARRYSVGNVFTPEFSKRLEMNRPDDPVVVEAVQHARIYMMRKWPKMPEPSFAEARDFLMRRGVAGDVPVATARGVEKMFPSELRAHGERVLPDHFYVNDLEELLHRSTRGAIKNHAVEKTFGLAKERTRMWQAVVRGAETEMANSVGVTSRAKSLFMTTNRRASRRVLGTEEENTFSPFFQFVREQSAALNIGINAELVLQQLIQPTLGAIPVTGARTFLKGIGDLMSKPQLRTLLRQMGIFNLDQAQLFTLDEALHSSNRTMSTRFANIATTGTTSADNFSRLLTGASVLRYIEDAGQRMMGSPSRWVKDSPARVAENLRLWGVKDDAIRHLAATGKLPADVLPSAIRGGVDFLMLRPNALNMPGLMSEELSRTFFQFWSFMTQQTFHVFGRGILQPALKGDLRPVLRLGAGVMLGGTALNEVIDGLFSKDTQERNLATVAINALTVAAPWAFLDMLARPERWDRIIGAGFGTAKRFMAPVKMVAMGKINGDEFVDALVKTTPLGMDMEPAIRKQIFAGRAIGQKTLTLPMLSQPGGVTTDVAWLTELDERQAAYYKVVAELRGIRAATTGNLDAAWNEENKGDPIHPILTYLARDDYPAARRWLVRHVKETGRLTSFPTIASRLGTNLIGTISSFAKNARSMKELRKTVKRMDPQTFELAIRHVKENLLPHALVWHRRMMLDGTVAELEKLALEARPTEADATDVKLFFDKVSDRLK